MARSFEATAEVAASVDETWRTITDLDRATAWMPGVERVSAREDGPYAAGKRFVFELARRGRGRIREMTLAEWDPDNHVFALSFSEAGLRAHYQYRVAAAPTGARVTLAARCQPVSPIMKLLAPLIVPLMAKHDSRQVTLLKEIVEREG